MKRFLLLAGTLAIACTLAVPVTADASAKFKFNMPKKFDRFSVNMRGITPSPLNMNYSGYAHFQINNLDAQVLQEGLGQEIFSTNKKRTVFKFKRKRDRITQGAYLCLLKPKLNKKTGDIELLIKLKTEGDYWEADPLRNVAFTEAQLADMAFGFRVYDGLRETYPFHYQGPFERKSKGWKIADKYLSEVVCGNDVREQPYEDCDGTDDAECPGKCEEFCNCPFRG